MEIGIVGLPNVGKSTIFNALTSGGATASNYPFTTIEPNVGFVAVPDTRLARLTEHLVLARMRYSILLRSKRLFATEPYKQVVLTH